MSGSSSGRLVGGHLAPPVAVDALPRVPAGPAPGAGAGRGAAREALLVEVYWRLRDHAAQLRDTTTYRRARERWEANRDDERTYRRYALHEWHARGIETAAREIAEQLGVPEHEIERDRLPTTSPEPRCDQCHPAPVTFHCRERGHSVHPA